MVPQLHASSKTPYVGMGGGRIPDAWGPDAHHAPIAPDPTEWEGDPPSSPWLRLSGLLAAILALLVAVVFAFNLGRGGDEPNNETTPTPDTTPQSSVLKPAAVTDFDPFGDPQEENPESVPNSTDGDKATAWETSTYKDGPDITVYKAGVGLLIDLGSQQDISSVSLDLVGSPTHVQLLVATGDTAPTTTDGLDVAADAPAAGTTVDLTPEVPMKARYLVVWLTALPQVSGGYRGGVGEIVVHS